MILKSEKIKSFLSEKKHIKAVYIIVIIGVALLCVPSFFEKEETATPYVCEFSNTSAEDIEKILSRISGVGKCSVLITYKSSGEQVTAKDISNGNDEKNVIIGSGSGERPFIIKEEMPEVLGVLVVCDGGGNTKIKNQVTEAVSVLCGVSLNRVKVFER